MSFQQNDLMYRQGSLCPAVASLGLVSPGAATEGVTPILPEKLMTIFSHHHLTVLLRCHPYVFFLKN